MAQANSKSGYDVVVPRDLSFNLTRENVSKHWFNNDPWNTIWMTSILAAVPEGERWVMRSAAMLLDKVEDPAVRKAGVDFCKQERIHAREHDVMNDLIIEDGLPIKIIEERFVVIRDFMKKHLSPEMQGALAASGEHFTAIIASVFLEHPEAFKDTHPEIVNMLYWHFVEETEHKAVSFDVFTHASGNGKVAYLRRVVAMASITAFAAPAMGVAMGYLLWKDKQLTNISSARRAYETMFGEYGIMNKFGELYFPFYRRDFHPWDDDNREVIDVWKAAFEESGDPEKAYKVFCQWHEDREQPEQVKSKRKPKRRFFSPSRLRAASA